MKRKLLTQIRNEWRSNLWLAIQLLVASVALWYIFDYVTGMWRVAHLSDSRDIENCFVVELGELRNGNPGYIEGREAEYGSDVTAIVDRLRQRDDVECVAMCRPSAVPSMVVGFPETYQSIHGTDSVYLYAEATSVEPDYLKVFRVHGANGETPEEMARLLGNNDMLISDHTARMNKSEVEYSDIRPNEGLELTDLVGRMFESPNGSKRLAGVIKSWKREKYDYPMGNSLSLLPQYESASVRHIVLRTNGVDADDFINSFVTDGGKHYSIGNLYISDVTAIKTLRDKMGAQTDARISLFNFLMGLVLLSVFMGVLATFWFRIQKRVGEIAIRKVSGATDADIFRRLLGEGIMLLTIVTLPALGADWLLTYFQLNSAFMWDVFFEPVRFFLVAAMAYVALVVMIVLAIWFPARKAVQIDPAIALKDE